MNRYAFIEMSNQYPFSRVAEIVESEDTPLTGPVGIPGAWYALAAETVVQVGWKATYSASGWIYSELTYQDHADLVSQRIQQRLGVAQGWLNLNPLQYKVNLEIATPEEETQWLAYQQYYVAVADVRKQADYPYTIVWPVVPF
ncbi:tail fiber assembly protein [Pseudomonas glycinis]|jgi:hypothetical protein